MVSSGIEFNGHNSSEFGLYVSASDFTLVTPERDLTMTDVAGVDGSIICDNDAFKSVIQPFHLIGVKPNRLTDAISLKRNLSSWLKPPKAYRPLHFSGLPGYYWEAICYESEIYTRTNKNMSDVQLSFSCKPFLKSDVGQNKIVLPGEIVNELINEEDWPAEPLFHVVGSGNMVLTINGDGFQLNGVDEEVWVDSENQQVYKSLEQNRSTIAVFPNHEFPKLKPGKNNIGVIGAASVEIIPNWRTLA